MRLLINIFVSLCLFHIIHAFVHSSSDRLKNSCCSCNNHNITCPYCTYGISGNACSLTGAELTSWVNRVNSVYSKYFPAIPWRTIFVPKLTYQMSYLTDNIDGTYMDISAWPHPCSAVPSPITTLYGVLPAHQCSYFTMDSCTLRPGCLESYSIAAGTYTFCSARFVTANSFWSADSGVASQANYCGINSNTSMVAQSLTSYLESFNNPTFAYTHNTAVVNGDTVVVTASNTTAFQSVSGALGTSMAAWVTTSVAWLQVYCTDDSQVSSLFKPNNWGFWSNVAIVTNRPTPCSNYGPFNSTHDVCLGDLFLPLGTPLCPDTFIPTVFEAATTVQIVFDIPVPIPSGTCAPCVDYFVQSANASMAAFADMQNQYAQQRQQSVYSVLSDVWDLLSEFFFGKPGSSGFWSSVKEFVFEAIDYFLQALLDIVGAIIINSLKTWIDLLKHSQSFLDDLMNVITQILDALFVLVSLILKILIGIIIQAEQHFLIFEYLVLFLLVNSKLLNNNIFSLIIVLLVMIVFGIDRHSPSILLYLYNAQYSYVNMSYYQTADFTYKYQINYHHRLNGTYGNITLGPPSLPDIPKYNISPPLMQLPPPFIIESNPLDCDDFSRYPLVHNLSLN